MHRSEVDTSDHLSILTLYARYARAIDSGDGPGYAGCYSEDGKYRSSTFGEATGFSELSHFAVEHYKRWIDQGIQTRHWNNQVLLEPMADGRISGSVYVMLYGVRQGELPQTFIQTVYSDILLNTQNGWRLQERASNADSRPDPSRFGFSRWQGADGFK
jgi:3-phenylpropionate/cinnamic acid dioxygenase small subunit